MVIPTLDPKRAGVWSIRTRSGRSGFCDFELEGLKLESAEIEERRRPEAE